MAEGTVRVREMVHENSLADDEVAVSVSSIIGFAEIIHPKYEYPVEVGRFTAWRMVNCQRES